MADTAVADEIRKRKAAAALLDDEDTTDTESAAASDEQPVDTSEAGDSETSGTTGEEETVRTAPERFNPNAQSLSDYFGKPKTEAATAQQPFAGMGEEGLDVPPEAGQERPPAVPSPLPEPPRIHIGPEEEGGQRYVIDADTGQKVPYAEPATAEDKAAQPPSGVQFQKE